MVIVGQGLADVPHLLLGTSAHIVGDQGDHRLAVALPRGKRQAGSGHEGGILGDVVRDQLVVARITRKDDPPRIFLADIAGLTKTHLTHVADEDIRRQHVPVTPARCAKAEIVLFAVALAEGFFVEQAHLSQALHGNQHAKADGSRDIDRNTAIDPRRRRVQFRKRDACRHFIGANFRIAANGRVVGHCSDAADLGIECRVRVQPVQPVVGNLRVAVEQHDRRSPIGGEGFPHCPIDGADEAEVFFVLAQLDASLGAKRTQILGHRRFRRLIVVDQQSCVFRQLRR